MIRLLLWLLGGGAAAFLAGAGAYRVARPRLLAWRARQQARISAEQTCSGCQGRAEPFDPDTVMMRGHYWHRACLKKILD